MKNRCCRPLVALLGSVVFLLCMGATARAQLAPRSENGHWYEVVYVPEGITWTEAKNAAKARGGYLVCITSARENEFVYSLISHDERYWVKGRESDNHSGPWIGAYQTDKLAEADGHWAWVSGETWDYRNWCPGEPNNWDVVEDYGCFFGSGTVMGQQWNDSAEVPSDGERIKAYVVEYDRLPPSTEPSATTSAPAPTLAQAGSDAAASAWDWPLLGSWILIGILLAALIGVGYLWNRARMQAQRQRP